MGFGNTPITGKEAHGCDILTKDGFATGEFSAAQFLQDGDLPFTDVLSDGSRRASTDRDRHVLEGPDLHAAGHAVGLPRPGPQRRPVLPCRGRSPDRPSRLAGAQSRAARRREPTARRGSVCPSDSSPPWPAWWGETWTRRSTRNGSGRAAASTCSTARRSPCPTRRRTARSTR